MKTTGRLAVAAALILTSVSAFAGAYIRPEVLWSQGKMEDTKSNKVGIGLAAGRTLGTQNEHDIGVSISQTDFTDSYTYQETVGSIRVVGVSKLKLKAMPVMLNYRYVFPNKAAAVRPYLGAAAGVLSSKLELSATAAATSGGSTIATASMGENKSTTSFSWGATAGLVWKITDVFSLDFGYRYSQAKVKISDWDLDSTLKVNSLVLGGTFRF